jgi:proline iminopeptidase
VVELYPPIEPYQHGMLDVGDGNLVYWEECGNPEGKPALVVHGGPGSGCSPNMRRAFDPQRYRVVLFDQRGCGRSTPNAAHPGTDLSRNTTDHLIADMERLREHLGIDRWLVHGGSWGSALSLAYAQRYPQRVTEIVLAAVTTGRADEYEWLYAGASRFFPEAWQRFRAAATGHGVLAEADPSDDAAVAAAADRAPTSGTALAAAYSRLLEHPDTDVRLRAARAWCAWEDALVGQEPGGAQDFYSRQPPDELIAFVRICAHYAAHSAWLADDVVLRDATRLAGIPGILVHGRLDLSSPLDTGWELSRAWPDAELVVLDGSGHQGTGERRSVVRGALDRFAAR